MELSAWRNVIRLTPSTVAMSTSDGSLSPGFSVRETIKPSSQAPIRIWAGTSLAPARSKRSASTRSSMVNARTLEV